MGQRQRVRVDRGIVSVTLTASLVLAGTVTSRVARMCQFALATGAPSRG